MTVEGSSMQVSTAQRLREIAEGGLDAVWFDYGNTLVPFSIETLDGLNGDLEAVLSGLFGPVDRARLDEIRDRDRHRPYQGEFRENDLREISVQMVHDLFGCEPTQEQVECILQTRYDSFLRHVCVTESIAPLLGRLGGRYGLGLVSNYPDGRVIRQSLVNLGLAEYFGDRVVVSGDVGHAKPHPLPFQTLMGRMGLRPDRVLYVGDNWLGDIQGSKRLGMRAALIRQHELIERFDPAPGDLEPDVVIEHIEELAVLAD